MLNQIVSIGYYLVQFSCYTKVVSDASNPDGVVKTLHLVRCYNFSIITTYRMYAEMIEKLHASNRKFFTYPSEIEVFTSLSILL